jgi:hypothetical protein
MHSLPSRPSYHYVLDMAASRDLEVLGEGKWVARGVRGPS